MEEFKYRFKLDRHPENRTTVRLFAIDLLDEKESYYFSFVLPENEVADKLMKFVNVGIYELLSKICRDNKI